MKEYTSDAKRFSSIYKSSRKQEMYVYVDRSAKLDDLPEALLSMFGTPLHVMDMVLTKNKKLARADAQQVLDSIAEKGFYLQMPPADAALDSIDPALVPTAPKDSLHG